MSHPYTNVIANFEEANHKFIAIGIDFFGDKEAFFTYIIPIIKEMYGIGVGLEQKVSHMEEQKSKNVIDFIKRYTTPNPDIVTEKKPWLKVTRNELPELLARDLLQKLNGVDFPFCDYADKEDPDMPKLGVDSMGFVFDNQNGNLLLKHIVIAEVKTSDQDKNPPDVVGVGDNSLFYSLKSLASLDIRFKKAIAKAINKLQRGEFFEILCSIADSIEQYNNISGIQKLLMSSPVLMRKHDVWCEDDFGKFRTNYDEIQCDCIKFYILTVNFGLVEFADEIYCRLRNE